MECGSYRAISFPSTAFYVYTKRVKGRIGKFVEYKLSNEQAAFRRGEEQRLIYLY